MGGCSFIITGQIQAGKSTLCWQLLEYLNQTNVTTGGVITLQNNKKWFYLIREKVKIAFEATENVDFIPIGQFHIPKDNLNQTISSIRAGINADYLFVDEIGQLELQGSGYYPILNEVFSRRQGNILVVRESLLDNFLSQFPQTKTYKIIQVRNHEISIPLNTIKAYIEPQF
ncbi:MAG: nucleoside-triphosphatase [Candidatus Thorarchaeota archaeon]